MEIVKVHFGGCRPHDIDYRKQADGFAEVWLYNDIHEEADAEGNREFVADGVAFRTMLTQAEVEAQRDIYFKTDSIENAESNEKSGENPFIEDEQGNKYKQIIRDGAIALELVEDYKGVYHL